VSAHLGDIERFDKFLRDLEARVSSLERRVNETHTHALQTHGERLAEHDRRIHELHEAQAETRTLLHALATQVDKLSDVATAQSMTVERIDRNMRRLLEIAEGNLTVIVAQGRTDG
jgi:uncharacterized coiled-coil protein SlyX